MTARAEQLQLDTAPFTTCDQCSRWVATYHRDELGRTPRGVGYGPWRTVPHNGRRGGCYEGTRKCVGSDRETGHLAFGPGGFAYRSAS